MKKRTVTITMLTGAICGLFIIFSSHASTMGQSQSAVPSHMIMIGSVVKIEGATVTLAAAANPELTNTFVLNNATDIVHNGKHLLPASLIPGNGVVVRQDVVGTARVTRKVEIIE